MNRRASGTHKFEKGDLVQVKSGGPKMTVNSFDAAGAVHCVWFDGTEQKTGRFSEEALVPAEEEE